MPEPPAEPVGSGGYAYAAPAAPVFAQAPGFTAGPATFAGPGGDTWQPPPAAPAPPPAAVASSELAQFPRAAFLDRAAAFVIDIVLLLFVSELFDRQIGYRDDEVFFPLMLVYFIGFWTWKGTTIGGIVANLRVVKTNGGELSFLEGLVRGLTGILWRAGHWRAVDPAQRRVCRRRPSGTAGLARSRRRHLCGQGAEGIPPSLKRAWPVAQLVAGARMAL
jgi:uncharacterized RDD family membrane protein YckC